MTGETVYLDLEDWNSPQPKVLIEDVPMVDPYSQQCWEREVYDNKQYQMQTHLPNKQSFPIKNCARRRLMPVYDEGPWGDAAPLAFSLDDDLFPEIEDSSKAKLKIKSEATNLNPGAVTHCQDQTLRYQVPDSSGLQGDLLQGIDVLSNSDQQEFISFCEQLMNESMETPQAPRSYISNRRPKRSKTLRYIRRNEGTKRGLGLSVDDGFYFDGSKYITIKIIKDGTGSFRLVLPKSHPHNKGMPEDVPVFAASIKPD